MIKKAFVVGNNVKNSLSPHIFGYWFKKYKIKGEYFYKQVEKESFYKELKKILKDKKVCGLNITIPFKEMAIKETTKLNTHAKKIGAINCVTIKKKHLIGKNTDWKGFFNSIKNTKNKNKKNLAIVIGYGGAAKAIIYALKKMKYKKIIVFNRTLYKIKNLKTNPVYGVGLEHLPKFIFKSDLIINTTPKNPLKTQFKNKKIYKALAFDAVYKPKETGFLSHFAKKNRIYGISMLVFQAAPCFEEWFGKKPKIDKELFKFLEKKIN